MASVAARWHRRGRKFRRIVTPSCGELSFEGPASALALFIHWQAVLLDERQDTIQFGRTQAEAAQEFITRHSLENVEVCSGRMASTAEEVAVAGPCLVSRHAHRILIVTSAYHTRRALAIFRHRLPQYEWSVTAAPDESAYGTDWWRRRAWAKTWLGESERLAWWELVDRWRYGSVAR